MVSPTFLTAAEICVWLTQLWSLYSQTTHPPHPKLPVPALPLSLGHTVVPCTLLGCSGESPGMSCVPLQPVVQNHTVSVWSGSHVLSLSEGRMHPVRGARVQHLHCSGHHTPQPLEVTTCRLLSCPPVTSWATCLFRWREQCEIQQGGQGLPKDTGFGGLKTINFDHSVCASVGLRGQHPPAGQHFTVDLSLSIGHEAFAMILLI